MFSCLSLFVKMKSHGLLSCESTDIPSNGLFLWTFWGINFRSSHESSSIAFKQPLKEKQAIDILILTGHKKERKRASVSKNLAVSAREQWDPLREGPGAAHTGLDQPQGW